MYASGMRRSVREVNEGFGEIEGDEIKRFPWCHLLTHKHTVRSEYF